MEFLNELSHKDLANMSSEELRQLAKDTVDRMTDQECAELLEWVKKEFPELITE